jgi:hypothetical protein
MMQFTLRFQLRQVLIGAGVLGLAVLAAAGVIWYLQSQDVFGVPRALRESAPFPVYYVRDLPDSLKVDQGSYKYEDGVLSFTIGRTDGRALLVTEQAVPEGFDIDKFTTDQMTEPRAVITQYGKAVVGLNGKTRAVSLKADKTWLLVSAPENVSSDDMAQLAEHLQRQE